MKILGFTTCHHVRIPGTQSPTQQMRADPLTGLELEYVDLPEGILVTKRAGGNVHQRLVPMTNIADLDIEGADLEPVK